MSMCPKAQRVWREGFGKVISMRGLEALRDALKNDDPRLTQGSTTTPPALMCVKDCPCEAACAVGVCGLLGEEKKSVSSVELYFLLTCTQVDVLLKERAACRWFLNWFDDTPRNEMRASLLEEVEMSIAERVGEAELITNN